MSRRKTNAHQPIAIAVMLGSLLAGCSDIYLDRRETVSFGAGDAVAANEIEQMNDPWPRNSENRHLTFNGQRMQRAVECYRKDKVTPPVDINPAGDVQSVLTPPPPPATCDDHTSASAPQSPGLPQ